MQGAMGEITQAAVAAGEMLRQRDPGQRQGSRSGDPVAVPEIPAGGELPEIAVNRITIGPEPAAGEPEKIPPVREREGPDDVIIASLGDFQRGKFPFPDQVGGQRIHAVAADQHGVALAGVVFRGNEFGFDAGDFFPESGEGLSGAD